MRASAPLMARIRSTGSTAEWTVMASEGERMQLKKRGKEGAGDTKGAAAGPPVP